MVRRTFARQGKTLVVELGDHDVAITDGDKPRVTETFDSLTEPARRVVELSRTRLGQGWLPTSKPKEVVAFVKALDDAGVRMIDWIVALGPDELPGVYRAKMKSDPDRVTVEVFRRRPDREVFAWLVRRGDFYFDQTEIDLTKAVKDLAKDPAQARWIAAELQRALDDDAFASERGTTWARRTLKKLAVGPAPKPVKPNKPIGNEGDLLQQIAATPGDDGPRLVYADWLLQNNVGWGECIVAGCALAALAETDPKRAELQAALTRLEAKHAKAWLAPIRPFIRNWKFERGMISRVTCDAAQFIEAASAIALRAPGATVELNGLKRTSMPALTATSLAAFKAMILHAQRIDDAGMTALAASSAPTGVAHWGLAQNKLTDAGLTAIAESASFASTETLDLTANWGDGSQVFTAAGLGVVLGSRRLTQLRDLRIEIDSIGSAFAGCKARLQRLDIVLRKALVGDDIAALVGTRSLAGLVRLGITTYGTSELVDRHVEALLARMPKLEELSIAAKLTKATEAKLDARRNAKRRWYDS